jgi:hypothetical protein
MMDRSLKIIKNMKKYIYTIAIASAFSFASIASASTIVKWFEGYKVADIMTQSQIDISVYKVMDATTTCYISVYDTGQITVPTSVSQSISCVK